MKAEDFIKVLENEDMLSGCELNKSLLIELLNSFASQQKWIPVSERLPEKDEEFMCSLPVFISDSITTGKGRYDFVANRWYSGSTVYTNIIAWQPLPEPYKP